MLERCNSGFAATKPNNSITVWKYAYSVEDASDRFVRSVAKANDKNLRSEMVTKATRNIKRSN